jgi:hypothetical protein
VLHRGRVVGELREGELHERALLSLAHGNGSAAVSS